MWATSHPVPLKKFEQKEATAGAGHDDQEQHLDASHGNAGGQLDEQETLARLVAQAIVGSRHARSAADFSEQLLRNSPGEPDAGVSGDDERSRSASASGLG